MTPSQLYKEENKNGKLKAEIRELLSSKALSRYEAEELIQLNVLGEDDRARKINQKDIRRIKENHNMLPSEKLDLISQLYTLNGYEVVDRDRLTVELTRTKRFSYMSAFLWFLFLGVGLIIYILYYLVRGDDKAVIIVEDNYKEKPENQLEEIFVQEYPEDSDSICEEDESLEDVEEEQEPVDEGMDKEELQDIQTSEEINELEEVIESEETKDNLENQNNNEKVLVSKKEKSEELEDILEEVKEQK